MSIPFMLVEQSRHTTLYFWVSKVYEREKYSYIYWNATFVNLIFLFFLIFISSHCLTSPQLSKQKSLNVSNVPFTSYCILFFLY